MNDPNPAPLVRPFPGLRAAPDRAAEVAAPPYDVLTSDEARRQADGKPWSFLHVSKAEIDLAPGTSPHAPEVYRKAAENFRRMIEAGVLVKNPRPGYYIYRLGTAAHEQIGIVVAASVAAYDRGRIRRHELTRPDKEDDRVRQIEAVGAHTGPVFAMHRTNAELAALVRDIQIQPPDVDVAAKDGVRHSLWPVFDESRIERITRAFEKMEAVYIADGHHRSAAASRVAANWRTAHASHDGNAWSQSFLLVSFPVDAVRILDYNRVVRDLAGMTPGEFLRKLAGTFSVTGSAVSVRPRRPHEFSMYLAGAWHRLTLNEPVPEGDALARLDVNLLARRLLGPFLGVGDPRTDKRIDFVGGARGLGELERRVQSGEMAVAFALHPTSLDDLLAVADARGIMPPKSTWFEPKLADGLVSLMID